MEKAAFYKNKYFWGSVIIIGYMAIYLFGINCFVDGIFPTVWITLFIVNLIRRMTTRDDRKGTFLICLYSLVIILNYILFRYNLIYIPNYILIFIMMSTVFIYELKQEKPKYKLYKIVLVVILLIGFFSIDYYQNSSNLIKDRNFSRFIKKEYGIKGRIEKEDLKGIAELFIDSEFLLTV